MKPIKKRLVLVICITFLLTLTFHLLLQVNGGSSNTVNRNLLGLAMGFPFLAIFIVQKLLFKDDLFKTLGLSLKLNIWFLVALLLPIVMFFLVLLLSDILVPTLEITNNSFLRPFFTLVLIGLTVATLSALLEEIVWRGYFYYYTEKSQWGPLSFIVAIIWSVWHVPVAIFYKYSLLPFHHTMLYTLVFCLQLFFLSLLISFIRIRSNSAIAAALIHGMVNALYYSDIFFVGLDNILILELVRLFTIICILFPT
ncbi:MAG: CPBP family intramembrane metalloprotease [Bacillaceae bacterium]|nr:CPBP family intramembrane metalloprotease [Bacillaceae bacterium]